MLDKLEKIQNIALLELVVVFLKQYIYNQNQMGSNIDERSFTITTHTLICDIEKKRQSLNFKKCKKV